MKDSPEKGWYYDIELRLFGKAAIVLTDGWSVKRRW